MSACVHCPMISYMSVALLPTGYWDGQWARVVHAVNFRIIHFFVFNKIGEQGVIQGRYKGFAVSGGVLLIKVYRPTWKRFQIGPQGGPKSKPLLIYQ